MSGNLEAVIKHMIKLNNHKSNISFPAIVVNTDNLVDGFIDVKPLVNNMNPLTGDTIEYPPIRNVQVLTPSTKSSSITVPVTQGDTVELLFQSVDIVDFVNGNTESHDPYSNGWGNLANVVALVGFTPYQQSAFNPNNYSNDFNNQDLNIVHNKNTGLESSLSISTEGSIQQKAPNAVSVDSPLFDVKSDVLNANSAVISTAGDVVVKGQSVNQFMVDLPKNIQSLKRGYKGWTPVLSVEDRSTEESVLKISDWIDGEGDKPTASGYVSVSGIVDDINKATNIKGAKGKSGAALSEDVIKNIVNNQVTVDKIMDLIQGQIDESTLSQYLNEQIQKIGIIEYAISKEVQDRIDSVLSIDGKINTERNQRISDVLSANNRITLEQQERFSDVLLLNEGINTEVFQRKESDISINSRIDTVVSSTGDNTAAIQQEVTARTDADSAISSRIDTLVTVTDGNTAAITSEVTARTNSDEALSTRIDTFTTEVGNNNVAIQQELTALATADTALGQRIDVITTSTGDNTTAIQQEVTARTDADSALGSRIDTMVSKVDGNTSAITSEATTRADADSAISSRIDTVSSKTDGNSASIVEIRETVTNELGATAERIDIMEADYKPQYADASQYADAARSVQWTYWKTVTRDNYATNERITVLQSDVASSNATVIQSLNTLATKDEALASSIEALNATAGPNTAAIQSEATARSNADSALSTRIDTVQSSTAEALGKANTATTNIATIQTELTATTSKTNATATSVGTLQTTVAGNTASIETAQSSIDGINLQYTVKLDSGGKVSGFGLMNDGATSAFDVRADRFSISAPVGKPNDVNGTSPFMVLTNQQTIDGVTVPAGAYARNFYAPRASIDTIQIKDAAIKTAQIDNLAVTTGKIDDLAVTTAKIDNLAVKSAQIDNLAVTSGKIANLAVDTLQINDYAVTVPRAFYSPSFPSSGTEGAVFTFTAEAKDTILNVGFEYWDGEANNILRVYVDGNRIRDWSIPPRSYYFSQPLVISNALGKEIKLTRSSLYPMIGATMTVIGAKK